MVLCISTQVCSIMKYRQRMACSCFRVCVAHDDDTLHCHQLEFFSPSLTIDCHQVLGPSSLFQSRFDRMCSAYVVEGVFARENTQARRRTWWLGGRHAVPCGAKRPEMRVGNAAFGSQAYATNRWPRSLYRLLENMAIYFLHQVWLNSTSPSRQ